MPIPRTSKGIRGSLFDTIEEELIPFVEILYGASVSMRENDADGWTTIIYSNVDISISDGGINFSGAIGQKFVNYIFWPSGQVPREVLALIPAAVTTPSKKVKKPLR